MWNFGSYRARPDFGPYRPGIHLEIRENLGTLLSFKRTCTLRYWDVSSDLGWRGKQCCRKWRDESSLVSSADTLHPVWGARLEKKTKNKKKRYSGASVLCSHQREMSPKLRDAKTATAATVVTELATVRDLDVHVLKMSDLLKFHTHTVTSHFLCEGSAEDWPASCAGREIIPMVKTSSSSLPKPLSFLFGLISCGYRFNFCPSATEHHKQNRRGQSPLCLTSWLWRSVKPVSERFPFNLRWQSHLSC